MDKIKVSILGGTGYTGAELLRLLLMHPHVQLVSISSRAEKGKLVSEIYPHVRSKLDLSFSDPNEVDFTQSDVVISATPNAVAMNYAKDLYDSGVKLIDLAADFRLSDAAVWEQWYGVPHACPELLPEAVYGLPEIHRDKIKKAKIVANPGCYPTATTLGLMPLISSSLVDTSTIIADCKSGVSGAGRAANVATLFSEVADSFKAYGASAHRHHPEIQQTLASLTEQAVQLTFVPHLVPMLRGIHATLYADLLHLDLEHVHACYQQAYLDEPFVDVLPLGAHPETRSVKSSNMCRIAVHQATGSGKLVVLSVIDNLTKGAAGQAVQNLNLMFGLDETCALETPALLP